MGERHCGSEARSHTHHGAQGDRDGPQERGAGGRITTPEVANDFGALAPHVGVEATAGQGAETFVQWNLRAAVLHPPQPARHGRVKALSRLDGVVADELERGLERAMSG